jgi:hypothetical protein
VPTAPPADPFTLRQAQGRLFHLKLPGVRHTTGVQQMGLMSSPLPEGEGGGEGAAIIEPDGGGMLYGRGDAQTAFQPGHVSPGQPVLTQTGALRFAIGERAYAAEYDANGNMASRVTQDGAQVLLWDAENRLIGFQSSTASAPATPSTATASVSGPWSPTPAA